MQRTCYIIGCLVLSASQTFAHPGHGSPAAAADSIQHYLFSPLHSGPIVTSTAGLILASWVLRRGVMRKRRNV